MVEPSPNPATVAPVERRAAAMEEALEARGMHPAEFIAAQKELIQDHWDPKNGARVVAKAWTDPAFRQRLLSSGRAAVMELGIPMPAHHQHLVALENTPQVHNVICCTLCSCTAFTVIGLPPDWYKELEYRARIVRQSRTVLKDMALTCRRRPRSGCGIPRPTHAISWCPSGRRGPRAGRRSAWPASSRAIP